MPCCPAPQAVMLVTSGLQPNELVVKRLAMMGSTGAQAGLGACAPAADSRAGPCWTSRRCARCVLRAPQGDSVARGLCPSLQPWSWRTA